MSNHTDAVILITACWMAVSPAPAQFAPAGNPLFSGHNPTGIVASDFNGDGIPDLAVANQIDNSVSIFIGDGRGNFASQATGPSGNGAFPAGLSPSAIAAAKFNKQGHIDLAIPNINADQVTILVGDGLGGFQTGPTLTTGKGPVAIATGDFNGDSNTDVATANLNDGTVSIFFGDGAGAFPRKSSFTAGKFPIAIVAQDLNADGITDVAVANQGDGTVTVLMDPGSGKFKSIRLTTPVVPTIPPVTQILSAITAGNFKGHSSTSSGLTFLDLAVTYYDSSSFQGNTLLFVADEAGGYNSPPAPVFTSSIGLQPDAIATGTFAAGGFPGVAIANYRSNNIAVFVSDGAGNFSATKSSPYSSGSLPRAISAADLTGDGLSDIAAANYNDGTVTVLVNTFPTGPAMVSAASGTAPVAQGALVSIYGTGLVSPGSTATATVSLTDSSGFQWPMQVVYFSATQINAIVPPKASTGQASFNVNVPLSSPQKGGVALASLAPGLFSANSSGKGPADGYVQSLTSGSSMTWVFTCSSPTVCQPVPFSIDETGTTSLVLYGVGVRNQSQLSAVTVTIGSVSLTPFYAGPASGLPGVDQIAVLLPASLAHAGTVFVQVAAGGNTSNQVTIQIM